MGDIRDGEDLPLDMFFWFSILSPFRKLPSVCSLTGTHAALTMVASRAAGHRPGHWSGSAGLSHPLPCGRSPSCRRGRSGRQYTCHPETRSEPNHWPGIGKVGQSASIKVDHINIRLPVLVRAEQDLLPIRRPIWGVLAGGIVGQAGDPTAIGIHDIQVIDPCGLVAVRHKYDLRTIR